MRIKYPSIFPSKLGALVIGPYPHGSKTDFYAIDRQPFLCVEQVGPDLVCRAAQPSFELAAQFIGPNRWIVWPDDCRDSTSCIYGGSND